MSLRSLGPIAVYLKIIQAMRTADREGLPNVMSRLGAIAKDLLIEISSAALEVRRRRNANGAAKRGRARKDGAGRGAGGSTRRTRAAGGALPTQRKRSRIAPGPERQSEPAPGPVGVVRSRAEVVAELRARIRAAR